MNRPLHNPDKYTDFYNEPADFGLELVAEIDYSDGCYCFDLRCVWRDTDTGLLYTARDAGCSCPAPFEDFADLASLDRLHLPAIEAELRKERADRYGQVTMDECERFLEKVKAAMRVRADLPRINTD